jgi:hypothetical protein
VHEHPAFLQDALENSVSRLVINSPWITGVVVNAEFIKKLRVAVRNHSAPSNKPGPDAAAGEAYGLRTNSRACGPCNPCRLRQVEVVGMPEAHGLKDVDDFILSLIRNPAFAER